MWRINASRNTKETTEEGKVSSGVVNGCVNAGSPWYLQKVHSSPLRAPQIRYITDNEINGGGA